MWSAPIVEYNLYLAQISGLEYKYLLQIEGAIVAVFIGFAMMYALRGLIWIRGNLKMKKRAKLSKEVCLIIEDHVTEAFSTAISEKWITIDEARQLYARFARLGFWGLHPRKFAPKKSELDLTELKQRLQESKAAREASKKKSTMSIVDKLLEGLDTELA